MRFQFDSTVANVPTKLFRAMVADYKRHIGYSQERQTIDYPQCDSQMDAQHIVAKHLPCKGATKSLDWMLAVTNGVMKLPTV